jgi:hypothetical protein
VIRAWLSRRRPAPGGHRAVDETVYFAAQFDFQAAQIEVLQRMNASKDVEIARLRAALAPYKHQELMRLGLQQFMAQGAANARRIAEEPTAQVSADQFRRTRPAPATEQWGPR